MAIYLVRHGESEGNRLGVFQGSRDYPLSELGLKQARALGNWLAGLGLNPSAVYSSTLQRAWSTAEIVANALGITSLRESPELSEYHGGEIEGLGTGEIVARFPGYKDRPLQERGDFSDYGGESYDSVQERLSGFVKRIYSGHGRDEDILAVGHGGSIYQLLKLICGWPPPRHYFTRIGNCCCFKLGRREIGGHEAAELEWMVPLELMGSAVPGAGDRSAGSAD